MNVLADIPQCAMECFLEVQEKSTPMPTCDFENIECLCSTALTGTSQEEVTRCALSSCSSKDSIVARNITATACEAPIRDASQTYTTLAITFSVISSLAVIQRFAAKILSENLILGIDDYMVLFAACIQAPLAAIGVEGGVANGLGRDIWTLTFDQITNFSFFLYVFTILYFLNITVIKLAFLFFYLRVFPNHKVRRYLWATIAFTCVFGFTFVFTGIFQCRPVSHYWERWTGEEAGTCVNVSAVAWANGAMSIALDLWIIGIPLSQVRGLSLDRKKKAEVTVMFCVGLFVTIMSAMRLHSLIVNDVDSPNATWFKRDLAVWSTVEVNVGIICACLPSMRSLWVIAFSGSRRSSKRASRGSDFGPFRKSSTRHFGTVSRSMAEPFEDGMPRRPPEVGIRMERTCAVEYETLSDTASDEARLVRIADPGVFHSSNSSIEKPRVPSSLGMRL
ncbi:hypothetical protein ACO1O0_002499 [Amphichorda felina]